jgi:uncharacterized protein involved in exopolysaccharide biosynthesis
MDRNMLDSSGYERQHPVDTESGGDLSQTLSLVARRWRPMLVAVVAGGALGAAGSYLVTPQFTSITTILPPQQQQSLASMALSSMGPLAGIVGSGASKSPADEYVTLMQSVTVSDRIIDRFKLMEVYDAKYRRDARKELASRLMFNVGKKDGLISIGVDDTDPARAAAMANRYVDELRALTSVLAVSEAQQRRVFFQKQMEEAKGHLATAQFALQDSGFSSGAIKAEPKTAADEYARLRAEMTAAEVALQTIRNSMTETSPEAQYQIAKVAALRSKLDQLEQSTAANANGADYISKYREFKYQETLFDLMAKQYELARVDESREGALIQVVDPALPAEVKTTPRRSFISLGGAVLGGLLMGIVLWNRDRRERRVA